MALVPVTAVMVASHISLDILQITVLLFGFVRREMYWVKSEASVMAQLHDALWYICKTADWDAGTRRKASLRSCDATTPSCPRCSRSPASPSLW
jgi:hypothetical protein